MANITQQFVKKIYEMQDAQFPDPVMDKSQECFVDYVSVVIGGCKVYIDRNKEYIKKNYLDGKCHIFGLEGTTDLHTAVLINAFNAHVLELDDSHRVAMTHLGAPIFSALIGVAEIYDCTLEQILKAAVVGYETAIRLANAIQPGHKKRGFHVTGTCCTAGCAMGIASMLNYSEDEMRNVFSASVTSAAGLLAVISGKSEQKPYNCANAAVAGVNAALYGKFFEGAVDILGDSRGFFHAAADEVQAGRLFEEGYAILSIYQKLYAACRHCHAPMEAMLKIRDEFSLDDVEKIVVKVYDIAINGHDHTEIEGISSAKQSIPYGVAAACIFGDCGSDSFTDEKIGDERISNLIKKVAVVEDPELTALVPEKRAAIIEVVLRDGTEVSQRVDYAKGEPENPITQDEWMEKFCGLLRSVGIEEDKAMCFYQFLQAGDGIPVSRFFINHMFE